MANESSTSLHDLMLLLTEAARGKVFGNWSFSMSNGQIGVVKFEEHLKGPQIAQRARAMAKLRAAETTAGSDVERRPDIVRG